MNGRWNQHIFCGRERQRLSLEVSWKIGIKIVEIPAGAEERLVFRRAKCNPGRFGRKNVDNQIYLIFNGDS